MLGLLAGMAVSLALPVVAVSVAEQDFPSKPIRIIAPFLPTEAELVLERTHFARKGRPFQFARVLYRTDRYQQVVYFSRRDEGPYRTPQQRAAQMEEVGEPMVRRRAANSGATS
jgi:hypothetical protein